MRKPGRLTDLLVRNVAVATFLSVGLLIVVLLLIHGRHIHEQTDRMLYRLAQQDAADVLHEYDQGIHVHEAPLQVPALQSMITAKYALILNANCDVEAQTGNVRENPDVTRVCTPGGGAATLRFADIEGISDAMLRVVMLRAPGPNGEFYTFVVGVEHAEIDASLRMATMRAVPAAMLAAVMIVLAAWWATRRVTSDLTRISRACEEMDVNAIAIGQGGYASPLHGELATAETAMLSSTIGELIRRIEQLMVAQQQFIAEASHELRTPLTALKGEIEVALRRERTAEEYRESLKWAQEDVERLVTLSKRLLDATLSSAAELQTERTDVVAIVNACLQRSSQLLALNDVCVDTEAPDAAWAHADAEALSQVVDNLLVNSVQHAGTGKLVIRVVADEAAVSIRFSDGALLDGELVERLFVPFQRDETTGGHGLGLYIARELMRRQGGDLRYSQAPTREWVVEVRAAGSSALT